MLEKNVLGGKKVRVTFTMPAVEGVDALFICGDFNAWSESAAPMVHQPDGSWSAALTLEAGQSYRFRYKDNRGRWYNDSSPDAYVPNEFGTENSVLDLAARGAMNSAPVHAAPKRPAQAKNNSADNRRRPKGGPGNTRRQAPRRKTK